MMFDGTRIDEFKKFVAGLECTKNDSFLLRLDHSICGCNSEAGELMGDMKKLRFYQAPMNEKFLLEFKVELSDLFHYVTMAVNVLGISFDELIKLNTDKLNARYPNGYNQKDALNRDIENEERAIKDGEGKDN